MINSTSKYIAGHSDALGGCLCFNNDDLHQKINLLRDGKLKALICSDGH